MKLFNCMIEVPLFLNYTFPTTSSCEPNNPGVAIRFQATGLITWIFLAWKVKMIEPRAAFQIEVSKYDSRFSFRLPEPIDAEKRCL